jgi:ribosome-binding protein aMBF1 (putative translation factor)
MAARTYAERLRAARAKLGLTRAEAAKQWKINLRTLEFYERGKRQPFGLYREKIERILTKIEKE